MEFEGGGEVNEVVFGDLGGVEVEGWEGRRRGRWSGRWGGIVG